MTKKNAIYTKLVVLLETVCFALYFTPQSYAVGDTIFRLFQVGIILTSIFFTLIYIIFYKINFQWLNFCMFYASFYLFSTFLAQSNGSITSCLFGVLKGVGFITIVNIFISYDIRKMLLSFSIAGSVMCSIHLLTVFKYYNIIGGMRHGYIPYALGATTPTTQNWYFLTYDNESIFYFLPLICVLILYAYLFSKKAILFAVLFSILIGYSYAAKHAATAIVSFLFFIVAFIIFYLINRHTRFSLSYNLACLIGLSGSLLAIIGIGSGFLSRIALFLGKDPTFTGRSFIWQKSISYFFDKPVFGNGIEATSTILSKIGQNHCHNILLQIVYTGGVLTLIFFCLGIFCSTTSISLSKMCMPVSIISIAVIAFFIAATLDWYPSIPIPFLLFLLIPFLTSKTKLTRRIAR